MKTTTDAPKRVAIYARISDDSEGSNVGVDAQIADCRKRAEREGWLVVATYPENDTGASRHSKKARPMYRALIESAERGEIDVILAYSNSRLTRRVGEYLGLIDLHERTKVLICTVVSGDDDLSSADGRMVAKIKASVDEAEADRISERVTRRVADKVAAGEWLGGPRPFGWGQTITVVGQDGQERREYRNLDSINEGEASMIREGAEHILNGGSVGELIRRWNAAAMVTARGSKWRHVTVNRMLCRWRNAGVYEYKEQPRFDVPASWEPILTVDEVHRLRALLADPKRGQAKSYAPVHPLAGIAVCGKCGSVLRSGAVRSRGKSYAMYRCTGTGCGLAILIGTLNQAVDDFVVSTYALNGGRAFDAPSDTFATVRSVREQLADVLKDRAELEAGIGEGWLTLSGVKPRLIALQEIEKRLRDDEATAHRNDAHAALVDAAQAGLPKGHKVSIHEAAEAKTELRQRWAAMPLESRRRVLRALFAVTVFPGRGQDRVKITGPGVHAPDDDRGNMQTDVV